MATPIKLIKKVDVKPFERVILDRLDACRETMDRTLGHEKKWIHALFEIIEAQEKRIIALEAQFNSTQR